MLWETEVLKVPLEQEEADIVKLVEAVRQPVLVLDREGLVLGQKLEVAEPVTGAAALTDEVVLREPDTVKLPVTVTEREAVLLELVLRDTVLEDDRLLLTEAVPQPVVEGVPDELLQIVTLPVEV